MFKDNQFSLSKMAALTMLAASLAGCSIADRLSTVGAAPALSSIENPTAQPGYQPVSMPMPTPERITYQPNSLWRSGGRAFFRDQRAARIGDIMTVKIDIADSASVNNATTRSRDNKEGAGLDNFLGYESALGAILPEAVVPGDLANFDSTSSSKGTGKVDRKETIELTVAAVVTQILPNGNMVIEGRQEVRVNFEVRELIVSGVVRPEDITAANTINHSQIAEARISYGGRGQLTDVQQPRYGQQVYDILMPF
ncbi:MAG: flagellar basal body L-ring protein [Rhodobiaceae bacterium]|nr:flagellar basal body L-ring protein [Rhodobiaceae bacterium]